MCESFFFDIVWSDIPKSLGHWPMLIVIAEPVMNPEMAGAGIKSTRIPSRTKPINMAIAPVIIENATAICSAVTSGYSKVTLVTV